MTKIALKLDITYETGCIIARQCRQTNNTKKCKKFVNVFFAISYLKYAQVIIISVQNHLKLWKTIERQQLFLQFFSFTLFVFVERLLG